MKYQFALLAIAAGTLWSQQANTIFFNRSIGPGAFGSEQMQPNSIKGAPYSADVVTETTQVLADGNRIVNRQTGSVARDSQGRTRHDTGIQMLGPAAATGKPMKITMIHDPVAQVTYTLESATKTARKVSTGTQAEADAMKRAAEKAHTEAMIKEKVRMIAKSAANVKTESLGTQVIEGVMAEGTRTTETIPAGEIGNEKDIQIVNEFWRAQDLKAVILSKRTDPRMGETSYRLTNIQRAEPAASVFEVPADYQVVDGPSTKDLFYFKTQE
jgi:hypothetical protein